VKLLKMLNNFKAQNVGSCLAVRGWPPAMHIQRDLKTKSDRFCLKVITVDSARSSFPPHSVLFKDFRRLWLTSRLSIGQSWPWFSTCLVHAARVQPTCNGHCSYNSASCLLCPYGLASSPEIVLCQSCNFQS
jgi:hypothetical protein